jgi:glutamine synthetase
MEMSDDLWLSRYILYRVAEKHGVTVTLHPKPVQGDWNGAGMHTNFSTAKMREELGYETTIIPVMDKLENNVEKCISVYGVDNELRLTGLHETCDINTFKWGVSDRGASIRIPWQVAQDNKGYFEDRRPAANADPYEVSTALLEVVSGD